MDKTLISENSGSLYMQHLYGKGEIGLADLALGLGDYLRYKVGMLDLESWVQGMAVPLAGRSEPSVVEEARDWFEECVIEKIYPEASALVADHRDAGDLVAIVSGAVRFVIEPLAERLEIEHVISTRFEVVDERNARRDLDVGDDVARHVAQVHQEASYSVLRRRY